jgi:alpha,alpha-trehalose phosphorylase
VTSQRLVSFRERSVAAIRYEVEAVDEPARVALQSNLAANFATAGEAADPRGGHALGPALESRLAVDHDLRVVLGHRTRRSGLSLAAGMEHIVEADGDVTTLTESEPDLGRVTLSVALEPGRPLVLVKLLAYHWSSQQSLDWLRDQVDASLENALAAGFDGLIADQRAFLDAYWDCADIELDGDPEIQQALRFALFHVLQASARAETRAIAGKGLTGPGYDGHAFWDTESFVLPVLTYAAPKVTRQALIWRHSILPQARERAGQLGLAGAALPWRTIAGEECSAYWPAGTAAFHVNADVAHAVARYVAATGDEDFERDFGVELLVETARLWYSLGHHGPEGEFRIDGVTGPDEYSALVDDNVYTNLMAQLNLREAAEAVERHPSAATRLGVHPDEPGDWRAAAAAMYVPFDERLGIHPQDQDFTQHAPWDFDATPPEAYPLLLHYPYLQLYRRQVVKQPDLVLALFTRGDAFSLEQKRADFEYYERITVRDSSLSACTQAIIAAEVGHLDLAYDYLAEAALMDLADLEHNGHDGVHIASLGGAALAAICGLGGARDYDGRLTFAPRLPMGLTRLAFAVTHGGGRIRVEVRPEDARYELVKGDGFDTTHWGEALALRPGEPVTRPIPPAPQLEPPRQPSGREPLRRAAATGAVRAG